MAGVSSWDTEESLIESLKGLFTGNDKTRFGSAYHKIIEGEFIAHENEMAVIIDTHIFIFNKDQFAPALNYRDKHPYMVHELDLRQVFQTNYGPMQVSGRIDGLEAMIISDVKCKFKSPDYQEYIDSCQWKFYLKMYGLDTFHYDIFEVIGFNELGKSPYKIDPAVRIVPHEPLVCHRYPDMEAELDTILNDFLSYINNRNFWHLLKPAVEELKLQDILF